MADRRTSLLALFDLLQQRERDDVGLTDREILTATGWKATTLRTYENKGLFASLLDRRDDGSYRVTGALSLTFDAFKRRTTQSQYLRDVAHAAKQPLARALLKKASENMILALEVFNRPSLENRLDAFVLLFCCAWEQFLKARIVEAKGEAAIFKAPNPKRHRETIGLQECLDQRPSTDATRRNLEQIKYLRDRATHLLMPEIQPVAARLFQAGILNFAREYEEFAKVRFLPTTPLGLFTLVGDATQPTVIRLQGRYGDTTGQEILDLFRTLSEAIDEAKDQQFAIGLEYHLVFTKDEGDADIRLTPDAAGPGAIIIEKPRDIEKTHPLSADDVVVEVNRVLGERYPSRDDLEARLVGRKGSNAVFTDYDLQAAMHREGWRRSNNGHHHVFRRKKSEVHCYSPVAVEDLVRRIVGDPDYVKRCRADYKAHRLSTPRAKARK